VRHGVETVAAALGVSRFTVYNYLNRETGQESPKAQVEGSQDERSIS
jgi:transposase